MGTLNILFHLTPHYEAGIVIVIWITYIMYLPSHRRELLMEGN